MVKDEACGTWWYCVNRNGSRWLVDGDKPTKVFNGSYSFHNSECGWISLDDYISGRKNGAKLKGIDFEEVKFPDRTYEDGPLEIEIVKSGNVYWYDD